MKISGSSYETHCAFHKVQFSSQTGLRGQMFVLQDKRNGSSSNHTIPNPRAELPIPRHPQFQPVCSKVHQSFRNDRQHSQPSEHNSQLQRTSMGKGGPSSPHLRTTHPGEHRLHRTRQRHELDSPREIQQHLRTDACSEQHVPRYPQVPNSISRRKKHGPQSESLQSQTN